MIHFSSLNEKTGSSNLMDCCKHIKRSSILGIDSFNFEYLIVQMSKSMMALKDLNALLSHLNFVLHPYPILFYVCTMYMTSAIVTPTSIRETCNIFIPFYVESDITVYRYHIAVPCSISMKVGMAVINRVITATACNINT